MKILKKFLIYWIPPFIWMLLIYLLSSRERTIVSDQYILNFVFFKLLHVVEYAFLYFLLFRATNSIKDKKVTTKDRFILPIFISILYALSDEIHQTFVPTREGRIRDVFIDTLGIYLMYIYIKNHLKSSLIKKFL